MPQVLVVDDSLFQRKIITRMLSAHGYEVYTADNGRAALETLQDGLPDCVLMDLLMPEMNGFEVLEVLQAAGNPVPIVICTADIQKSTHEECMRLGARGVLSKPVDEQELLLTLVQVMESL